MINLKLIRERVNKIGGDPVQTIGKLLVYKGDEYLGEFKTLELPWKNNRTGVSCIPPAPSYTKRYDLEWVESSPSFNYEHYWIKDVPNRTWIKIHRGNYYTQIEGCVLIGKGLTDINSDGVVDVTDSVRAMNELVAMIGKKEATIDITNSV